MSLKDGRSSGQHFDSYGTWYRGIVPICQPMGSPCLLSDRLHLASEAFLLTSRPPSIEVICLKDFLCYTISCPSKDMAANYWTSSQRRCWQFSRQALSDIREQLESGEQNLIQQYPLPDRRLLSLFFNQRMLSVPLGFED